MDASAIIMQPLKKGFIDGGDQTLVSTTCNPGHRNQKRHLCSKSNCTKDAYDLKKVYDGVEGNPKVSGEVMRKGLDTGRFVCVLCL